MNALEQHIFKMLFICVLLSVYLCVYRDLLNI